MVTETKLRVPHNVGYIMTSSLTVIVSKSILLHKVTWLLLYFNARSGSSSGSDLVSYAPLDQGSPRPTRDSKRVSPEETADI
jgi:hypothetical protein